MKALLSIIGGAISLAVLVLGWWLLPENVKLRSFKADEKERDRFKQFTAKAALLKRQGHGAAAYVYMGNARDMWLKRVRENRQVRK